MSKTERELAFLYDLYVSPDWEERFAQLIDEHVALPPKGRALYVSAGTGGHLLSLRERGREELQMIGVDESEEKLALARSKAAAAAKTKSRSVEFIVSPPDELRFADEEFDLAIGNASMVEFERLPEMLEEMVRVVSPGGTVALNVVTASSFGEFFSVFWEALLNIGLDEFAPVVETLIREQAPVSEIETLAARAGLDEVLSWTQREEFNFNSGEEFLSAPLISNFLLAGWFDALPPEGEGARERLRKEIARIIDEERSGGDFTLSLKATLVSGRKPEL